jgi:hypothetical protein
MRAAPSQLFKTARIIAGRTAGAGGASTWAAPSQLLQLAHSTASRTEEAGAASTRAAPRLLKEAALRINQLTAEARPGLDVCASMASHVATLWASRRRDLIVDYESKSAGAAALAHVATGGRAARTALLAYSCGARRYELAG